MDENLTLAELQQIFGSRMKGQEILFLLMRKKDVVRHCFYQQELDAVYDFCKKHSLYYTLSLFKIIDDDSAPFSNRGIRIRRNDPRKGMYIIYISKEEKAVYLSALAEQQENHQLLGEALGYPQCCIDYFKKLFSSEQTNLELPKKRWETNLTQRNNDYCILSHFPCSNDCEKSIALAHEYMHILESVDVQYAKKLKKELEK